MGAAIGRAGRITTRPRVTPRAEFGQGTDGGDNARQMKEKKWPDESTRNAATARPLFPH